MLYPQKTINCRGKLLSLYPPIVMGILNVTPDSFYDGGRYPSGQAVLSRVETMLEEGASIIDVGGMSSRPGAGIISTDEERQRVLPVLESIVRRFPEALISIDTVRSAVAEAAIQTGAHIINDISAGRIDPQMFPTVARLGVPYILMHMQGLPGTMQKAPAYEREVTLEVLDFFIAEVAKLRRLGVRDIILDPGFGFGKTLDHNYQLLKSLHAFQIMDLPVLAGLSRKSMIYKLLGITPGEALNGTTALQMVALQQGAALLRVHDVKEAVEVVRCWQQLEEV